MTRASGFGLRASIGMLLVGCHAAPADEPAEPRPPAAVTCATIAGSPVAAIVEVSGQIAPPPRLDAIMSSPVAGRVVTVAVEEGDRVAAGALVATVEDPALPAGTIEARAQVASAQAAKVAADLDLIRQQHLVDSGVGARRDLDEAHARVGTAQAELDAAKARSGLADRQLARRELHAPHAGVVLHLWKRAGESVDGTSASPIVEIADLTVLELRAQVPPRALVAIAEGMPATVRVIGVDTAFTGKVVRVAPAVDPTTLLGTIRIALDGTEKLPIQSAATARITTGTHPGVAVPAGALRRSITGSDELVVCDKGAAHVRAVTIGSRDGDLVEIAKGLAPGEQIVVDHVLGLDDGQPLVPK